MSEVEAEQEDEFWMNGEGKSSRHAPDLIRRVREGKATMPPGFGLSSRKNEVTLFPREAVLQICGPFASQAMRMVSPACAEENLRSSGGECDTFYDGEDEEGRAVKER